MTSTGPQDAYGRPLTRAEIDVLVREAMQLERDLDGLGPDGVEALLDRTPYRVTELGARRTRTHRRQLAGWIAGVGAAVALVLVVVHLRGSLVTTAATEPHVYADGHYAFLRMQPDGRDLPIGYNPCKRVPVWVNYLRATPDIKERVDEAIAEINAASGMHLYDAGATGLRIETASQAGGIVIAFGDTSSDALLGGGVIGFGGSASYPTATSGSTSYYVGGGITLDVDDFNPGSHDFQRAVLLHEIGHTLGLAHATGSTEIMNPTVNRSSHYQHGDLTGLARLGQLPCQ